MRTMKALTFSEFGDASVLHYRDVERPSPRDQELLVEMRAIGVNFADIYRRKGNYYIDGSAPFIAGYEGSGVVVEVNGDSRFRIGDEVCFVDVPRANAEFARVPADRAIPLPVGVTHEQAASALLQGMTAIYLTEESAKLKPGSKVFIHAASGGVGRWLVQMCRSAGCLLIAGTSSEGKRALLADLGVDATFVTKTDWPKEVLRAFPEGMDVVYDSVGSTLPGSLEIAKERGTVVFYGMSGGDPDPVNPRLLMDGSKALIGGDLWSFLKSSADRLRLSEMLFGRLYEGSLQYPPTKTFMLADGKAAHETLESGSFSGKLVLIP